MEQQLFSNHQRILHRLFWEAKFVQDVGLLYGQMGIILAMAYCYKQTLRPIYESFVDVLLNELVENLHVELSTDFAKGLSGIGWGMEFLLQKNIVSGNNLEICSEIDECIMKENLKRITDLTLETGIEGRLHYVLAHLYGCKLQIGELPFDKEYFEDIYHAICRVKKGVVSKSLNQLMNLYMQFYQTGEVPVYHFNLLQLINVKTGESDILHYPLGLKDGLSGLLVLRNSVMDYEKNVYNR